MPNTHTLSTLSVTLSNATFIVMVKVMVNIKAIIELLSCKVIMETGAF